MLHKHFLAGLGLVAAAAGGKIYRGDTDAVEVGLDIAPLAVGGFPAQPPNHLFGFFTAKQRRATVAFAAFGIKVVTVVALGVEHRVGQLVLLGLGFLDTDNIGMLLCQPVEKAFPGRRPNAVGIDGDNSHGHFAAAQRRRMVQNIHTVFEPVLRLAAVTPND